MSTDDRPLLVSADRPLLVSADRVLWPDTEPTPGWVEIADGQLTAAGRGTPERSADLEAPWLAPGLVDTHCHGGGGHSFVTTDPDEARAAARTHHAAGTTTLLASLVTASVDELVEMLTALRPVADEGTIAGIHLEGPWLSPAFAGAHDVDRLIPPTRADVDRVLAAAAGTLRMVTIAPELPGANDAIEQFVRAGVTIAIGHTDTDADGLRAAADAGATVVTHLYNAMRPLHHRDPGPIAAALEDPRLAVELIADGVHVHPEVLALTERAARSRLMLVTDAIAAAGCADGDYHLGTMSVRVADGTARLNDSGAIAGSTIVLADAVKQAVDAGWSPDAALHAATSGPARTHRLAAGEIARRRSADLVLLDDDLRVTSVLRGGHKS